MLDVYTEWVRDFIGKDPSIIAYNGNSLKSRIFGLQPTYANFHPIFKKFGYNTVRMDELDEADVIAIAAHEAGHYWTMDRSSKQNIIINLVLFGLVIANLLPLVMIVAIVQMVHSLRNDRAGAEYKAEEFVRKTIGPAMSFNNLMTLVCSSCETCPEGYRPRWSEVILTQVKDALKELEIYYENSNESKQCL